jgi:hypothetical protein
MFDAPCGRGEMRAFYFFRFPDVAEAAKIAAGLAATSVPCVFAPGDQTTMLFAAAYECLVAHSDVAALRSIGLD